MRCGLADGWSMDIDPGSRMVVFFSYLFSSSSSLFGVSSVMRQPIITQHTKKSTGDTEREKKGRKGARSKGRGRGERETMRETNRKHREPAHQQKQKQQKQEAKQGSRRARASRAAARGDISAFAAFRFPLSARVALSAICRAALYT